MKVFNFVQILWLFLFYGNREAKSTKTKQIHAGESLKLKCMAEVTTTSLFGIRWNVPSSVATSKRLQVLKNSIDIEKDILYYKKTIIIGKTVAADTGYYTCLYRRNGKQANVSFAANITLARTYSREQKWIKRVYVYVYSPSSLLLDAPLFIDVEFGEDILLPCRATHKNALVTYRRVGSSQELDFSRVSYDFSIGYVIKNATDYDTMLWLCQAKLFKNSSLKRSLIVSDKRRIMVNVLRSKDIAPKIGEIVMFAEKSRVFQDDEIQITCEVSVQRGGRVNFVWNTPRVKPNAKLEFGYEDPIDKSDLPKIGKDSVIGWSKLTIKKARIIDSGSYTCTVVTSQKNKTTQSTVSVYESPFITIINYPTMLDDGTIYAVTGQNADLCFKVDAFPKPTFQWFINETIRLKETVYTAGMAAQKIEISGSEFVIRNLSISDNGNYTLKIKTSRMVKKVTIKLNVIELQPPQIIVPLDDVFLAVVGEGFILSCECDGVPEPRYRWFHDDFELFDATPELELPNVKFSDEGNYTCEAYNDHGIYTSSTIVHVKDPQQTYTIVIVGVIAVLITIVLCTIWLFVFKSRKVKKLRKQLRLEQQYLAPIINPKEMPLEEQAQCLSYDLKKWEFPRDRLRFGKTLGRGAFGCVVQATAFDLEKTSSCKTIAVKMLKVGSRSSEYNALMSELKILIHLGPHLNIVNLLGACTTKEGPLMILVEYCRHGNLSAYLRERRDRYIGSQITQGEKANEAETNKTGLLSNETADDGAFSVIDEETGSSDWLTNNCSNRTSCTSEVDTTRSSDSDTMRITRDYTSNEKSSRKNSNAEEQKDQNDKKTALTLTDLLSYSLQVSRGMEFLASKKCIHRDLAARNILLSDYQVVKICDFGLARDVYKDPDYVRQGEARLPLKWMAPESIFDKLYTTKSDVWSFGVLLWEIFSLGGSPYPGLQIDEDFCNKLRRGVRMGKPRYSNDSMYSAMLACWADSPQERPTFTKLCEELCDVLQTEAGHDYLDIMKIFATNVEGKIPLRGVKPQQSPEETFELNKKTPTKAASDDYTDVEIRVLGKFDGRAEASSTMVEESHEDNEDSFIEITQESIVLDQLLTEDGNQSEDSGMYASTDRSLAYTEAGNYTSIDKMALCEPPPLYDDVVASQVDLV